MMQDGEAISELSAVTSVTSGPLAAALEKPDIWDLEVRDTAVDEHFTICVGAS